MNATTETTAAPQGEVSRRDIENVERALIDRSARGPVLTFFTTAIFWLLVSSVLGYIASKKLHAPEGVLGPEFLYRWLHLERTMRWIFDRLTYGRVWPAYTTAERATMVLDARPRVVNDEGSGRRALWKDVLHVA